MNGFDKVTISREKHCFYAGSKDTVYMTPLCRKMELVPIVCVGLRISAPWTVGKVPPILHQFPRIRLLLFLRLLLCLPILPLLLLLCLRRSSRFPFADLSVK